MSVELGSMVDVVATQAVADHGLHEGHEVEVGSVAIPEVGIDADLGSTAEGAEGDLAEALLADSVASALIFVGFVAFVADFALKLILHLFEPPFGSSHTSQML